MRVRVNPLPSGPVPPIGPGEAHVWTARLDEPLGLHGYPESELAEDERERASRLRHPQARQQFVRSRSLLRSLLARYLNTTPLEIQIEPRADGKPVLAGPFRGALEFNVSHTEGLALVAVSERPIGIDVERVRAVESADGLVHRFFSTEEQEQFRSLPPEVQASAFLRGWVCKEAVLKGIGCGARELNRCVVDLDPRRPVHIVGPPETERDWRIISWTPAEGYVAAVAVAVDEKIVLEV